MQEGSKISVSVRLGVENFPTLILPHTQSQTHSGLGRESNLGFLIATIGR